MREAFTKHNLFNGNSDNLAVRTKRLVGEVAKRLVELDENKSRTVEDARQVVETAAGGVGLKMKDAEKTQYLLFLGHDEINRITGLCDTHYDALLAAVPATESANETEQPKKKTSAKDAKRAAKGLVPKDVNDAFKKILDGGKAADLALFGRMLADLPEGNIDAASQVAHAISTNKINVEFDFYTAVDDLKPEDTEGADMLGTVEFNSACYYRYMNVDAKQLSKNLQGDDELTDTTIEAFVRAAIAAVPTGKQNSHAAQQRPSFIFAVARESNLCSLANAFVKPVAPDSKTDLVTKSINELIRHYGELASVYGEAEVIDKCFVTLNGGDTEALKEAKVASVDKLVERMRAAVKNGKNGKKNSDSPEGA
jgi:CRISPR system Cascade subunit CasC